mmetsp:Transcript_63478/g.132078  ORF Transcript_63478/g.132078 Transcript_63478/m.132078 type:complete len:109 (-) Transcript_63478:386-712(-)
MCRAHPVQLLVMCLENDVLVDYMLLSKSHGCHSVRPRPLLLSSQISVVTASIAMGTHFTANGRLMENGDKALKSSVISDEFGSCLDPAIVNSFCFPTPLLIECFYCRA